MTSFCKSASDDVKVVRPVGNWNNRCFLRIVLYAHLTIATFTGILTLGAWSLVWSGPFVGYFELAVGVGALMIYAGPIFVMIGVARSKLPRSRGFVVICTESWLTFAHVLALLPMVQ